MGGYNQNSYGSLGGMYGSRRGYRLNDEASFGDDYEESDHFEDSSSEFVEEELTEDEDQLPQFSDSIEREPSWERD